MLVYCLLMTDRVKEILFQIYAKSRSVLDAPSQRVKHTLAKELVDLVFNTVTKVIAEGDPGILDTILDTADVSKVHPEGLDMLAALVDGMPSDSVVSFLDRVSQRLEKVDELIKPIRLVRANYGQSDGGNAHIAGAVVISGDVRADARRIYRERAVAFGDHLREVGNLDAFYHSRKRS